MGQHHHRHGVDQKEIGRRSFAFTCPLITKSDGNKFGKTEKGNVWLDPDKTSPYQFYQFWFNATDADAEKWIRIFTFLDQERIREILTDHSSDTGLRLLQKALARELTVFLHGEEEYQKAVETTEKLFAKQPDQAESLSVKDLESMVGVVNFDFSIDKLNEGVDVVSFLAGAGIFSSRGEARKMVQQGGVSVNRNKVNDIGMRVDKALLLHGRYLLVQKGKKIITL